MRRIFCLSNHSSPNHMPSALFYFRCGGSQKMPRLLIGRPAFLSAFWRAQFFLAHSVPRAYIHSLRTDADRPHVQSDHKIARDSHCLYDLLLSGNARHLSCAIPFFVIYCFSHVIIVHFCFVSNTARVIFTFKNKRTSSHLK